MCYIKICVICYIKICYINIQDLKDFMRQAGEVTFAEAHKSVKNEG